MYFFPLGSLQSFSLPPYRNCELVSTSSSSYQQHIGLGGLTTATPYVTTPSLGLLHLLQERGISASPRPHHNLHYSHATNPSGSTERHKAGGLSSHKEGRQNTFSWNLVEKLQSLGLHRVAARGMTDRS